MLSANSRKWLFLLASFISSIGDSVLVFAVPAGMGLETGDLRSAVLMWLIPAVAMFASSFLTAKIESRRTTIRSDFGRLLIGIAFLEIIVSLLALRFRTPVATTVLITVFVFGYALAKEGIPKMLYMVAIYRFFTDEEGYSKIVGINSALSIASRFVGTILAAYLIHRSGWRLSLIIDASTFIFFGTAILFFGRDPKSTSEQVEQEASRLPGKELHLQPHLRLILGIVPLLFAVNALVWNYLPLLAEKYSVLHVVNSLILIAFLRLPGLISGFFFGRIQKKFSNEQIIAVMPALFLGSTFLFSLVPSTVTLSLMILSEGFLSGIYWTADFTLRNKLGHSQLVRFNTMVLRRLALFQFAACCAAIFFLSPSTPRSAYIPLGILGTVVIAWVMSNAKIAGKVLRLAGATLLTLILGCSSHNATEPYQVRLPSVSKDLRLRSDLTYAAMAFLNETSAHLVTVSQDLAIVGQVLKTYEITESGTKYVFNLNPDYKSARGESITADDVALSIRYYLAEHRSLVSALRLIVGADSCLKITCDISGLKITSPTQFSLTLNRADSHFVEKIASPWFVLLKKDHSLVEQRGQCLLPYQTGTSEIVNCDQDGVHLRSNGREVLVKQQDNDKKQEKAAMLLTSNPGIAPSPTLTILSVFANPRSSNLDSKKRTAIMSLIRSQTPLIAEKLKLRWSPLIAPRWLSVQTPPELEKIKKPSNISCPNRPLKLLLDTSLPYLDVLKNEFAKLIPCPIEISVTNADTYFQEFAKNDIGIAWFTPDSLELSDVFAMFACDNQDSCYFDWKDPALRNAIRKIDKASATGIQDTASAVQVEEILFAKGYATPIAEMNWWIKTADKIRPIHPAGLFQVRIGDFL